MYIYIYIYIVIVIDVCIVLPVWSRWSDTHAVRPALQTSSGSLTYILIYNNL